MESSCETSKGLLNTVLVGYCFYVSNRRSWSVKKKTDGNAERPVNRGVVGFFKLRNSEKDLLSSGCYTFDKREVLRGTGFPLNGRRDSGMVSVLGMVSQ